MVASFFRKLASQVKAKGRAGRPVSPWVRPGIEILDKRILPSVSTHLNPSGVLKVVAGAHSGSQIEIIQTAGQIQVEDNGQLVSSFDPSQVQQIDVKFRAGQHQPTKPFLDIPVNGQQMTLAGFAVNEADFSLNATSLTATVNASLPDGTAVTLAGAVDQQGNYDLTGNADIAVDGFALPASSFELTPSGMVVNGTATLGSNSVSFSGMLDSQGNYDLTASASVMVAGFPLNANFELTNSQMTVAATVSVPNVGNVNFSGLVDSGAHYNLTASTPLVLAGFASVGNANLVLNNAGLTVSAAMNLQLATVNLSGSIQPNGQFSLTGSANVGLAGFPPGTMNFTLTNSGVSLSGNINVFVATVNFTGTLDNHGNFSLTGRANVGLAGFPVAAAAFTLTNSGLTMSTTINVFVATVNFSGFVRSNGQFQLTGSANVGLAGFGGSASFTLNNSGVTMSANINVIVATVAFTGTVDNHGNFRLTANANVGLAGFPVTTAAFTLTNAGLSLSATINVFVAQVNFSGFVRSNGQFQLTGSARATFAGFTAATASFVLTNTGVTVSAAITLVVGTINFAGTLDNHGNFVLTANAHLAFAGFGATAALALRNSGLSVAATLDITIFGGHVVLSGTISPNGQFGLTGIVNFNFGPVVSMTQLNLNNSGMTAHIHATDDVQASINFFFHTYHVEYRGSFDATFAIASNGSFSVSGSFVVVGSGDVSGSQTITFSITNHQFVVRNSMIAVTILGVTFHPWGDAVANY